MPILTKKQFLNQLPRLVRQTLEAPINTHVNTNGGGLKEFTGSGGGATGSTTSSSGSGTFIGGGGGNLIEFTGSEGGATSTTSSSSGSGTFIGGGGGNLVAFKNPIGINSRFAFQLVTQQEGDNTTDVLKEDIPAAVIIDGQTHGFNLFFRMKCQDMNVLVALRITQAGMTLQDLIDFDPNATSFPIEKMVYVFDNSVNTNICSEQDFENSVIGNYGIVVEFDANGVADVDDMLFMDNVTTWNQASDIYEGTAVSANGANKSIAISVGGQA